MLITTGAGAFFCLARDDERADRALYFMTRLTVDSLINPNLP